MKFGILRNVMAVRNALMLANSSVLAKLKQTMGGARALILILKWSNAMDARIALMLAQ